MVVAHLSPTRMPQLASLPLKRNDVTLPGKVGSDSQALLRSCKHFYDRGVYYFGDDLLLTPIGS